jgi:uncharacterized lipoprotein YddW (UPF0748 family)
MSRFILPFLLAAVAAPLASGDDRPGRPSQVRAIWVTRFEWSSAAEIRALLANCSTLGFNTVLFQVRGQADAYYKSSIEPWAERLGGRDPGFDPLDVACRESKRLGLSLHAWVNAMPVWRGKTAPADRNHLYYRKPEWIVVDRQGRRQALNDHYTCLNPCLPDVREYLASVMEDIVARYPVDGLHLDYIRFIEGDWSYDKKSVADFYAGRRVWPSKDPAGWDAYRRDAVTETVRAIREKAKAARPDLVFSAAVYPTAAARARVLQDAEGWTRRGLIDWIFPMTYDDDDADYRAAVEEGFSAFRVPCFPGVGAYKHGSAEQTIRQMRMCRGGFAVFSYSSLFVSPDETRRESDRLCRARREALRRELAP